MAQSDLSGNGKYSVQKDIIRRASIIPPISMMTSYSVEVVGEKSNLHFPFIKLPLCHRGLIRLQFQRVSMGTTAATKTPANCHVGT
jgi:hypothetical protein